MHDTYYTTSFIRKNPRETAQGREDLIVITERKNVYIEKRIWTWKGEGNAAHHQRLETRFLLGTETYDHAHIHTPRVSKCQHFFKGYRSSF